MIGITTLQEGDFITFEYDGQWLHTPDWSHE